VPWTSKILSRVRHWSIQREKGNREGEKTAIKMRGALKTCGKTSFHRGGKCYGREKMVALLFEFFV